MPVDKAELKLDEDAGSRSIRRMHEQLSRVPEPLGKLVMEFADLEDTTDSCDQLATADHPY